MTGQDLPGIDELRTFAEATMRQAGTEAMHFYGKGDPEIRFDENLVTEAELRLSESFSSRLKDRFPAHQVFGDVPLKTQYVHDQEGCLWVYDALDGVANFQAGIPLWGTSLALLENFWPVFGMFYMPASGDLFYAEAGKAAYWNGSRIAIPESREVSNESLLFTYSRFNNHYRSGFPGKIRNLGCTAAHLCYVAAGRAEGALLSNVSYQDLAAAQIILNAAGGEIRKVNGDKFHLNEYMEAKRIDQHILAAPPAAHQMVKLYLERAATGAKEDSD